MLNTQILPSHSTPFAVGVLICLDSPLFFSTRGGSNFGGRSLGLSLKSSKAIFLHIGMVFVFSGRCQEQTPVLANLSKAATNEGISIWVKRVLSSFPEIFYPTNY